MPSILLEICVDSPSDARTAAECGADRLEVNAALELGGLTPTPGLVAAIRQTLARDERAIPLIAMLRPRAGNFVYRSDVYEVMLADLQRLLEMGVDGVALGALTGDGAINVARCRDLLRCMPGTEAVFHRAFDFVSDPARALEQLIDLGFTRVLTSGQATSAIQGAAQIARLIEQAKGRIEILPGAGVTPANVAELIAATGCDQVHGSLRTRANRAEKANSKSTLALVGELHGSLDPEVVRTMRMRLDTLNSKPR